MLPPRSLDLLVTPFRDRNGSRTINDQSRLDSHLLLRGGTNRRLWLDRIGLMPTEVPDLGARHLPLQ